MMKTVNENLNTPIRYEYDVMVAGGGVAGIAAALASARSGASTILCEREYGLGGLATLGLITIYLPLCDGNGRQVSFGIAEELLKLSVKHGYQAMYPKAWLEGGTLEEKKEKRYEVRYNPHIFATLCEQLLTDAGVKILYGTHVCATEVKDGRIDAVITESKGGRIAIKAKNYIDSTGDADLAFLSGEHTVVNPAKNPLASWYYSSGKEPNALHQLGFADIPDSDKGQYEITPISNTRYDGLDAEELTDFMIKSRQKMLDDVLGKRENDSSLEPNLIPSIPQLRMTRRIDGVFELKDIHANTHFDNSVGMIGNWRKRGPIIEIPYDCLYGKKIKNLITAGRCISSSGDMWDLTRVIPCCSVTGQAAGTAAAFGTDFELVDINKLQQKLCADGVELHI